MVDKQAAKKRNTILGAPYLTALFAGRCGKSAHCTTEPEAFPERTSASTLSSREKRGEIKSSRYAASSRSDSRRFFSNLYKALCLALFIHAVAGGQTLTLSNLEQMALSHSPTLAQASAGLRAAEGLKQQAGVYPNPTAGYYGDEIRGGSFRSGKQGVFVNQTILLGGKRAAGQQTAEQDRLLALTDTTTQRQRVLADIRTLYYQALAAQRMVAVRKQLLLLAADAAETAAQLGNVGHADRPDILQSEIENDQAQLDLDAAQQHQQSVWSTLAAVAGNPALPLTPLEGNLEDTPQLDPQEWLTRTLAESPQVQMAQHAVARAQAALREATKAPIPNLEISANVSEDNEPLEPTNRRAGLVGGAQIGIQLPIFNRNQGNIAQRKAEADRAQQEVLRVQLELRRQLNQLLSNYTLAQTAAARYRTSMLPRAQKSYDLYKTNYSNMAAPYPQVLLAQRTLFQLEVNYIQSLETIWLNATAIETYAPL